MSNWNFIVTDGNTPAEDVFSVQDGVILIQGNPFGYMYTKKKYADFTLEVEWAWVDKPSNSGIFLMISDLRCVFVGVLALAVCLPFIAVLTLGA